MAAGVVLGVALATAAPPAPPAGTPQEVVFFTADGPVRVRLDVTVNGVAAEQRWRAGVDSLFAFCDRNGDGVLDDKERAHFSGQGNRNGFVEVNGMFYGIGQLPQLPFRTPTVDRAALAEAFRAASLGPVRTTTRQPQADAAALTDALFAKLDTDADGKLSVDELAAARARLGPLDTDGDEWLTADELLERPPPESNPFGGRRGRMMAQTSPVPADALFAPAGLPPAAKQVLAARDKDTDGSLSAAELGCAPGAAAFAALDADGDGRLDADELAAWLRRPADLAVRAELAERESAAGLAGRLQSALGGKASPLSVAPGGRLAAPRDPDGALALRMPAARIRFDADTAAADGRRTEWKNGVATARTTFALLTLGKGVLERKALEGNPNLGSALPFFDLADQDADKKLTRAELDALILALDPLMNCRADVTLADLGRGLFELLDRDADGRLSSRELASAPALAKDLDRDADGKLGRDEPPRGYALTTRHASIDVLPGGVAFEVTFGGGRRAFRAPPPPADVPAWFVPADRNGDGDVSAREFAGPPALFARIDADGDGLVSPAEARAFEKKSRPAATRPAGAAQTNGKPATANPPPER